MPNCKNCTRSFRDNYNLNTHLLKQKSCLKSEIENENITITINICINNDEPPEQNVQTL